jgi:CHAD domain-containing protein
VTQAVKWIQARPDDPVAKVGVRALKARFEPLQHYLPLAAKKPEEDIEYVHQLRVWSRRAQVAIDMYRDLLPEWRAAWMSKQLQRMRKATNDARDDDVFVVRLKKDKSNPAAARLLKRVQAHRIGAQEPIREVFDRLRRKDRLNREIAKLLKRVRLRGNENKSKNPQFGAWALEQFQPLLNEFIEGANADSGSAKELHEFRIKGKKLRYAMELLAEAFPGDLRREVYPNLVDLQDKLGTINDHAAAQDQINRWIEEADDDREETAYLKVMLANERIAMEQSQREFADWWTAERKRKLREQFTSHLNVKKNSNLTCER